MASMKAEKHFQHRIVVEFEEKSDCDGVYKSVSRSSYFDGKNSMGGAVLQQETLCPDCREWYSSCYRRCQKCKKEE